MHWFITVSGDQQRWQDWCESFVSDDIRIHRQWTRSLEGDHIILVTCEIFLDPYDPIDSTGSMPSFMKQAMIAGFKNILVTQS